MSAMSQRRNQQLRRRLRGNVSRSTQVKLLARATMEKGPDGDTKVLWSRPDLLGFSSLAFLLLELIV